MSHHWGPPGNVKFLKFDDNPIELWNWDSVSGDRAGPVETFLVVNNAEPGTFRLNTLHGNNPYELHHFKVVLVNRGAPITLRYFADDKTPPGTISTLEAAYDLETNRASEISGDRSGMKIGYFSNDGHWHWLQVDPLTDMAAGVLAVSCDWRGAETLELWHSGTTKVQSWLSLSLIHI